jgi:hypothetical protein
MFFTSSGFSGFSGLVEFAREILKTYGDLFPEQVTSKKESLYTIN